MASATRKKYDWPQVALVAVVGGLCLAALVVLDIDADKIASVPLAEWLLIASALGGAAGTVIAAVRRAMVETAPAPTPVRHARERDTEGT